MNEAFMLGFLNELEKTGIAGTSLSRLHKEMGHSPETRKQKAGILRNFRKISPRFRGKGSESHRQLKGEREWLGTFRKKAARLVTRGKKDLFEAKGPKGKTRTFVSYIPSKGEKHIFHQPDVRRNIADVVRTLKKDPEAGSVSLKGHKREVPLSTAKAIKALRKRGKHFARGPAGKMEMTRFTLGNKK